MTEACKKGQPLYGSGGQVGREGGTLGPWDLPLPSFLGLYLYPESSLEEKVN